MGRFLPRFSVLLFALFLATILDIALYLAFDARSDILRTLAGERHEVLGKLPDAVANINALPRDRDEELDARRIALLNDKVLAYTAAPGISLHFLDLRGRVWRGELGVSPDTPPGRFTVHVFPREQLGHKDDGDEPSLVQVTVYASPAALRASYTSFSERFLGIGPWWLAMGVIPLAGGLLALTFRQGGARLEGLRAKGMAPIYKLARRKDHWELVFGLGSEDGIGEGSILELRDVKGRLVGTVTPTRVTRETAEARLALDADISPYHLVAKPHDPSPGEGPDARLG